jgi:hypothetical protein
VIWNVLELDLNELELEGVNAAPVALVELAVGEPIETPLECDDDDVAPCATSQRSDEPVSRITLYDFAGVPT